jgi:DNA mismatch repair protein MutL
VPTLGAGTIPWEELQHVGTFARCFLLFECQDKLLVVDQHAFHERILFEKLSRDQSLLSQSQKLLVPEALDMAPSDVAQLVGQKPALVARGFDFEDEGPGTLVVKAVPSILAGRDLVGLFGDLAKGLQGEPGGDEPGDTNAELARLVLATAACHGAVRAGEDLSPQDLKHLLVSARDVDFVQNCPHGRRVFRWWTRGQVAGWFDR